ncbi:hypothetical protein [Gordonia sp. NB41Y]|uniref:hypothetical protein n=1 Tax=Gordonia sp. NB41Y TaxID=875808 RepID=UPI0021C95C34|nr:hypothetical protein [Gordonia sp. NB41Y]WLP92455.1 hypothetical protein Q9K23_09605 [Gordonia sp. NB41Y]
MPAGRWLQQEEDLDLDGVVGRMTGLHGMPTVRLAIEHSVEVSGSVGESLSRAIMLEEGVPVPELQVLVELADGSTKFGDFGWRDAEGRLCVVGEFDGRFKYHRESAASGGRLAEDVIYDEKLREDAIRDCGIIVVRWTWDDLRNPRRFREKILTALRRAGLLTELA